MKAVKIDISEVTLDVVRNSEFGCRNCLWSGVKCKAWKKFKPAIVNGRATCECYTYYD